MDVYATDFSVAYKAKADPVTEADTRANAYIVEELRKAFPGDGIVAEESKDQSDALASGRCWYVDPVDGTREFVARNGEFAVMLGLAIDGDAQVGVVFQPVTDKLYAGVVGGGATLEQHGSRRDIRVSEVADPAELKLVVSRSHRNRAVGEVVERSASRRRLGSARWASRQGSSPSAPPTSTFTSPTSRAPGTHADRKRSCAPRAVGSPIWRAIPITTAEPTCETGPAFSRAMPRHTRPSSRSRGRRPARLD